MKSVVKTVVDNKVDAERYRWLKARMCWSQISGAPIRAWVHETKSQAVELDQMIDESMEKVP